MYGIDHCVAGCMTRYLPREILSPAEAKEVPRAKPEVLPRLPSFPKVDKGSYTPLHSGLSILYYAYVRHSDKSCQSIKNCRASW